MANLEQLVDGIPMVLVTPEDGVRGDVVLWMSHLGGSAAKTVPGTRALRCRWAPRRQLRRGLPWPPGLG
jgi:hypothetical protein